MEQKKETPARDTDRINRLTLEDGQREWDKGTGYGNRKGGGFKLNTGWAIGDHIDFVGCELAASTLLRLVDLQT